MATNLFPVEINFQVGNTDKGSLGKGLLARSGCLGLPQIAILHHMIHLVQLCQRVGVCKPGEEAAQTYPVLGDSLSMAAIAKCEAEFLSRAGQSPTSRCLTVRA